MPTLRIKPTDLEGYRYFVNSGSSFLYPEITEEQYINQLLHRDFTPEQLARMNFGTLFWDLVRSQYKQDTYSRMFGDTLVEVPKELIEIGRGALSDNIVISEVKAEMPLLAYNGYDVILRGQCDAYLTDGSVAEVKTTGAYNAARFRESLQWRCYTMLFETNKVNYYVFEREHPFNWHVLCCKEDGGSEKIVLDWALNYIKFLEERELLKLILV